MVAFNLETKVKTVLIEGGTSARYSPSGHLVYARNGSLLAVPFALDTLRVRGQPVPVASGVYMSINSGFAEFDIGGDGTLLYAEGPVEGPMPAPETSPSASMARRANRQRWRSGRGTSC